jgi:hypothetical protein
MTSCRNALTFNGLAFITCAAVAASACAARQNVEVAPAPAPVQTAAVVVTPPRAPANPVNTMRSDLRNLGSQQEIFYSNPANNYTYGTDLRKLGFVPSPGVTLVLIEGTQKGWSAIARHVDTKSECVIYMGEVANVPATKAGAKPERSGTMACD